MDEAVNVASQKMLFETRQISEEVAVPSGDLDLHNQLNPGNPFDIKRLKALQDSSKRVERQARSNKRCKIVPKGWSARRGRMSQWMAMGRVGHVKDPASSRPKSLGGVPSPRMFRGLAQR